MRRRQLQELLSGKTTKRIPPENNIKASDHLGLVGLAAKWMVRRGDDADEVFNAGFLGLLHAAKWWEPSKGAKFSTYAMECIKGQILSWRDREYRFRLRRWKVRGGGTRTRFVHLFSELGPAFVLGYDDVFAGEGDSSTDGSLDRDANGFSAEARSWLAVLKPRERRVIELRFGYLESTFAEIGKELEISKTRVMHIQAKAILNLAKELKERK